MLIALRSTPENTSGPAFAEQFFSTVHRVLGSGNAIHLEYARLRGQPGLFIRVSKQLEKPVQKLMASIYRDVDQLIVDDNAIEPPVDFIVFKASCRLRPELLSLVLHEEFEDQLDRSLVDPLAGILASLDPGNVESNHARIKLTISPATVSRQWLARWVIDRLDTPFWCRHILLQNYVADLVFQSIWPIRLVFLALLMPFGRSRKTNSLQDSREKVEQHCFNVTMQLSVAVKAGSDRLAKQRIRELCAAFSQFTKTQSCTFQLSRIKKASKRSRAPKFLISVKELATIFHPATQKVRAQKMLVNESRKLEPPLFLPSPVENKTLPIGEAVFQNRRQLFGIKEADRFRHIHIVGRTGTGKTALLERMIHEDICAGRGVGVIDPHGDLVDSILGKTPKPRTNDVVFFDPSDFDFPPSYNPLDCHDKQMRPIVAEELIAAIKKVFEIDETNSPRMLYVMRNALLALLESPGTTLIDLKQMLADKRHRDRILQHVSDPLVLDFWQKEFDPLPEKLKLEFTASTLNKIGTFLSSPITRNVLGQSRSKIDLRQIMDKKSIFLANLSKGRITENSSRLLGALLVSGIQAAAMGRATIAENERTPFFLYVDEFQNFATDSFATILSEARKYRLGLTVAHQYIGQLTPSIADAVFGNVGSMISFQVGGSDAEFLQQQFGGDLTEADLCRLPKYNAYIKLLIDGHPRGPFSMQTLPPNKNVDPERPRRVRNASRRRYSTRVNMESSKLIARNTE